MIVYTIILSRSSLSIITVSLEWSEIKFQISWQNLLWATSLLIVYVIKQNKYELSPQK